MIPKIIHQTIQDKKNVHDEFLFNINFLKENNQNYRYYLYDDEDIINFIKKNYSNNILNYYNQINPIYGPARADFFRYLLMYEIGGVYLDIKSTLDVPLEKVIKTNNYILSYWDNGPGKRFQGWGVHPNLGVANEFQQWHIIAPPKHPFLKAVISEVTWNIDNYSPSKYGVGKIGVLNVTGPLAYTKAILPIQSFYKHELLNIESLGFRYSITGFPGSELNHEKLFPNHYSKSLEPIILR